MYPELVVGVEAASLKRGFKEMVEALGIRRDEIVQIFDVFGGLVGAVGNMPGQEDSLNDIQAVAVAGEAMRKVATTEAEALKRFERVFVLYGGDATGLRAARKMATTLQGKGIKARLIRPRPEWNGKELSEWLSN